MSSWLAAQIKPSAKDMRGLYVVPCTTRKPGSAKTENIYQTCIIPCDLDSGDIIGKQAHLELYLGAASMVVLSGGLTKEGQAKRHLYWRLTDARSGPDLATILTIRQCIVAAVDADAAFGKLTQPIRVPGSIHGKNGVKTLVRIETTTGREYDFGELLDAAQSMPRMPDLPPNSVKENTKASRIAFADRQTQRVRAGGQDAENRFDAISGTIGHWVRQVRLDHVTLEDARKAVSDYNISQFDPPWSELRVEREFNALLKLDRDKYSDKWTSQNQDPEDSDAAIPAPDHSEDALADAFVERQGGDWRHVAPWGSWLYWRGTHWEVDDTQRVINAVRGICRAGTMDMKRGEAQRLASTRTIRAVERLASSDPRVATGTGIWDTRPHLLNTLSGTVDLSTGETTAARRADHLTQITSASPGPISSTWMEFLRMVTDDDKDLAAYLARVCGYCLSGDTSEQAFFFFHGEGANGKSVFIQTIAKVLGSYAATAPLDSFTISRTATHPTDLAGLRGKRLVTVTETEQGRAWAENRIKTITGGEPIRARLLYRDFFEFMPSFKLIVVGNHRPQLNSVGLAMRRRLQVVPFAVTIPQGQRDKTLAARLERELDGILGWMLEGHRDWRRQGLAPPDSVTRASDEYFSDEDLIGQWIDEQCDVDPKLSASAKSLFENWTSWADGNGAERGSQKFFGETLRSRNFLSGRTRTGRNWQGLAPRRRVDGADT